jgi:hypothetical protein
MNNNFLNNSCKNANNLLKRDNNKELGQDLNELNYKIKMLEKALYNNNYNNNNFINNKMNQVNINNDNGKNNNHSNKKIIIPKNKNNVFDEDEECEDINLSNIAEDLVDLKLNTKRMDLESKDTNSIKADIYDISLQNKKELSPKKEKAEFGCQTLTEIDEKKNDNLKNLNNNNNNINDQKPKIEKKDEGTDIQASLLKFIEPLAFHKTNNMTNTNNNKQDMSNVNNIILIIILITKTKKIKKKKKRKRKKKIV